MPTDIVFIIARVLMGAPFVIAGVRNFRNIDRLVGLMASRKVPQARIVTIAGVAVQTIAGLLIVLGILTPWAALGEAVFLAAATLIVHPFWAYPKDEQFSHINAFIVNTALVGAFLMLFSISI